MKRMILAIVLAVVAAVPAAFAKQVVFVDTFRNQQSEAAVFMDRRGGLYPPKGVEIGIDLTSLTVIEGVPDEASRFATLEAYYRAGYASDPCRVWREYQMPTACDANAPFSDAWTAVQHERRRAIGREIIAGAAGRDVVLLIHGFNSAPDNTQDWYEAVESNLKAREAELGRSVFPVRLYWDGLTYGFPPAIWAEAQFNGPWIGLELRRLLREVYNVDTKVRLRVLTHSSGAFVITNTLGDGSAGSEDLVHQRDVTRTGEDEGRIYLQRARGHGEYAYLPSDLNIRVAMLIPAQPLTAFSHFYQNASGDGHGDVLRGLIPERVVLGLSRRDFPSGKVFAWCSLLGDSCMAVRTKDTCSHLLRDLNPLVARDQRSQHVRMPRVYPVRFPWTWETRDWLVWHDHAVRKYMLNEPQWAEFTRALLTDDVGMPEAAQTCDGPADEVPFWNRVPAAAAAN